jgi:hypothetical protein
MPLTFRRDKTTRLSVSEGDANIDELASRIAQANWSPPGSGPMFSRAVENLPQVEDIVFGTTVQAGTTPVSKAIRNATQLGVDYRPLIGEHNSSDVDIGGYADTVNAATISRYASTFAGFPNNFVFEADALKLTPTIIGGSFGAYLRGNVGGAGINATIAGNVTTAVADIGLVAGDLAAVEVGDIVVGPGTGLFAVSAKNQGAGTISFDAVSCGIRIADTVGYHVTFTKFAWAPLAANVNNGVTTVLTFSRPVPSSVVPGCWSLGMNRNTEAWYHPRGKGFAKVLSVSPDRLTVTMDAPVNYWENITTAGNGGVIFVPGLLTAQLCSRRSYGPHRAGKRASAMRVEFTLPAMPAYNGEAGKYTKADIESALASAPGVMWGHWFAVWTFFWRADASGNGRILVPGYREQWSEIDLIETFTKVSAGSTLAWSGNLHQQPFTRRVVPRITGNPTWLPAAADAYHLTPNTKKLLMAAPIANGQKRSVGVVWTREHVTQYLDDEPICVSDWSCDTDYAHQMMISNPIGALEGFFGTELFWPQNDAQALGAHARIHSVKSWEL